MSRRLAAPATVAVAVVLAVALAVITLLSASGRAAAVGDPVLVAAGDIASANNYHDGEPADKTADIVAANLIGIDDTVAVLGDNAYEQGKLSEYNDYYTPTWGRPGILARTKPSVGNHEYETPNAQGYYEYFGDAASPTEPGCQNLTPVNCKGYYSYPLGSWHVVVLNSNCTEVSCAAGSPQEEWLRADLEAHPNACTLAYWHHPRFTSAKLGNNSAVAPFWDALYDAGAEVVLNGHAHVYERFGPQNPSGKADSEKGIREFVVGTGGKSLNAFGTKKPNSTVRLNTYDGVIKLTLHPNSYDWQFLTTETPNGTVRDSGNGTCHGGSSSTDTTPPTVTNTVPAPGVTGVSPTTDVTATFSENMNASTINPTTFKLKQSGTTTNIAADVSYNPTTRTATLVPNAPLQAGTTYKATVTVGAKDDSPAGNRLDQDPTKTGSQQKAWSFTVRN
jgi:acid phosphatase type 7